MAVRDHTVFHPIIRPEDLTPEIDVYGQPLRIGALVRSFEHVRRDTSGGLEGLDTDSGRICYAEGRLEAIGVTIPNEPGKRYQIKVLTRVMTPDTGGVPIVEGPNPRAMFVYPMVNGTRLMEFGPSFGVTAVPGLARAA